MLSDFGLCFNDNNKLFFFENWKVVKSKSIRILFLLTSIATFACKQDDMIIIETEEFIEGVIVPDTIVLGESANIKINYILSFCGNTYKRTEATQQELNIQFRVITSGEVRSNVGCPGSIIHLSTEYIFSPEKRGSYKLIFNNGSLTKNLVVF